MCRNRLRHAENLSEVSDRGRRQFCPHFEKLENVPAGEISGKRAGPHLAS